MKLKTYSGRLSDLGKLRIGESSVPVIWIIALATIVALRLFLTSDRDILAVDAPHDEFWYIHTASVMLFSRPYSEMTFIHLPIYSIWLLFWHMLGIPARLAIDAGWLLTSGYLGFSMGRLANRSWVAIATFLYLAFHPYPMFLFDRSLAETLLALLSAVALAGGIELWNCRNSAGRFRYPLALAAYAGGIALGYHTRKEGIVILAPVVVLAGWSWIDRHQWWSPNGMRRLVLPLLVAPLFSTLLIGTFLAGANYFQWGVFARYELAAPGYQDAMSALNSIDVGRTPVHISVTTRTLSAAYAQSPTFRELKPFLEGQLGKQWAAFSEPTTGIPGEIANGWFYWALRDAAARAGWHRNARMAEVKYSAAANEIQVAFRNGRLRKRPLSMLAFLDPDLDKWIWTVPDSFFQVTNLVGSPIPGGFSSPMETAGPAQFNEFVSIAGRRRMSPRWSVAGWIIAPVGSVVGLGTNGNNLSWNPLIPTQRPDVPGGYPFTVSSDSLSRPTELQVRTPDGKIGIAPLTSLNQGQVSRFTGAVDAPVGIDQLTNGSPIPPRLDRWLSGGNLQTSPQDWLSTECNIYTWISYVFWFSVAGCLIATIARWRRREGQAEVVMVIVLAAISVLARTALFGILDASSWNGLQARYVLPVVPSFACMGILSVAMVLSQLSRFVKGTSFDPTVISERLRHSFDH